MTQWLEYIGRKSAFESKRGIVQRNFLHFHIISVHIVQLQRKKYLDKMRRNFTIMTIIPTRSAFGQQNLNEMLSQ